MSNARDDITACLGKLVKIVLSEPTDKENYTKINIKPVEIKGERRCRRNDGAFERRAQTQSCPDA